VHFEDQLASAKKCGHMGGKVVVPISEFVQKLSAARLAADILGVPTVLIARTDANSASLLLKRCRFRRRSLPHRQTRPEGSSCFAEALMPPSREAWPTHPMPIYCDVKLQSRI
jgi:isocitrate lyase